MEYEQILYEPKGSVALITLNRSEKLNAWTRRMSNELIDAIRTSNDDPAVGAIVVTGAGRGFCAGADVRAAFQANIDARAGNGTTDIEERAANWVEVVRTAKPLIAAVNGVAVGVGLTMILPFDVIIASENARFGMFFVKMGLVPELASTYFLSQRAGFSHASEMCLTGRLYSAEEAARSGLANRVVPADQLMGEAMALAETIAANPAPQLRWIKDLITKNAADTDYNSVMALEHGLISRCYDTPEHKEAVRAFQEKRAPDFRGAALEAG